MDAATKQDLMAWLAASEYREPTDYVFTSPVLGRGHSLWLSQTWRTHGKKIAKKVTGKNIGLHSFRHTFATRVIKVVPKENAKTAQALLRHANYGTTMNLYAQANKEAMAAAVDALSLPLATEILQ
jgi:integrase